MKAQDGYHNEVKYKVEAREGNGSPLQCSCLENSRDGEFQGWRSLAGYSLWGHKESDTTETMEEVMYSIILGFIAQHILSSSGSLSSILLSEWLGNG